MDPYPYPEKRNMNPLETSRAREAALIEGLMALAEKFGVTLQRPNCIDSRGEISIIALHPDGRYPTLGCGNFGDFAAILNRHNPRCGVLPGAILDPSSGWCWMNHFDVERMVNAELPATPLPGELKP